MYHSNLRSLVRKKGFGLFLAVSASLMLAACGGSTPTSGNTAQPGDTQQTTNVSPGNDASESKQETVSEESPNTAQNPTEEKYVFEYDDVILSVDSDVAPVIEALGEPKGYFEAASCAFEGLDKTYTYNDFEIITYPAKDADFISIIVLRSDIVSTPEGISIGSKASKLTDTYGEGTEQNGMLVYEKGGMKLCFVIKDDKVASIEYHSSTLD